MPLSGCKTDNRITLTTILLCHVRDSAVEEEALALDIMPASTNFVTDLVVGPTMQLVLHNKFYIASRVVDPQAPSSEIAQRTNKRWTQVVGIHM